MVEVGQPSTLPHGTSKSGRWLRARRIRIAVWIAVVEGLLVALHVISWWAAIAVAAIAVLFYLYLGKTSRSDTVRQSSWIAAVSQALVVLVPILVAIVGTLALIAVGVLAVVALFVLFRERD